MHTITYRQAAELLGVQYITIKQAVARGSLTKYASRAQQALLIKEQVELFKDKKRISERSLNIQEIEIWRKYKAIAENPQAERKDGKSIQDMIEDINTSH